MSTIDLNADVGEMDAALDARILELVSSVSIACGGHAGDDASMRRVAGGAAERGVRIGARPSYVDPDGFGRTRQEVPADMLRRQIRDQIRRRCADDVGLPPLVPHHPPRCRRSGREHVRGAAGA
jgi:UPF0271 protein